MQSGRRDWVREIVAATIALPALLALVVAAFAWPAARLQPRGLPIGVSGPGAVQLEHSLSAGGAFDVHDYADLGAARAAIADRDVYGAYATSPAGLSVLTASAASVIVAQQLAEGGRQFAHSAHVRLIAVTDVVPTSAKDPHGAALSSAVLPLVFGGVISAVLVALALAVTPAWRHVTALASAAAMIGLGTLLVVQGALGALPNDHLATWAALSLLVLAINSSVAGLYSLVGLPGVAIGGALMIFIGNPFSGVTSAPELLPRPVGLIGGLLPPGAGASLIRDTAYFDGHGATGHLAVLLAWTLLGALAIVIGHRRSTPGAHESASIKRPVPLETLEPAG